MTRDIPQWVADLLTQVCKDEGRSKKPKIDWGISRVQVWSSGHYTPRWRKIRVLAGIKGDDHKQVFLHEICHWLTQPRGVNKRVYFFGERRKKHSCHNKRFWKKLKILLERYNCLTAEYREREIAYMKRSANYL